MSYRNLILGITLTVALCAAIAGARSQSPSTYAAWEAKFPDWKGQWVRIGAGGQYDPTKPPMRGQQPPLTPEYDAIWEKNIAEGRAGGQFFQPNGIGEYGDGDRLPATDEPGNDAGHGGLHVT